MDWEDFIIQHGGGARNGDLAHVLGKPLADVLRVKATGACTRGSKYPTFSELFKLWHGRDPEDTEWPVPHRVGPGAGAYTWQQPELDIIISMVGRISVAEIVDVLTARLRSITKDPLAERNKNGVQAQIQKLGLQASDLVGGLTIQQCGKEIGSLSTVFRAVKSGEIRTFRVGKRHVVSRESWAQWKSNRTCAPAGYVRLASLKERLAIKGDKLCEYASLGYVPTALRCNPSSGGPSTQFGTWYIDPVAAEQLVADRLAGLPMPWHGKAMPSNLRAAYKKWIARRHPSSCTKCGDIWGAGGRPADSEEFAKRYHPLTQGEKRHLTSPWKSTLTIKDAARESGRSLKFVREAIDDRILTAFWEKGSYQITRSCLDRWLKRIANSPDGTTWMSLAEAGKKYGFSQAHLRRLVSSKKVLSKEGTAGAMRGITYVAGQQVKQLREEIGFTLEEAAARANLPVAEFETLLEGVWRRNGEGIPLDAIDTVVLRVKSKYGLTLEEAAADLGVPLAWIMDRKDDGTFRVSRNRWNNRVYVSEPMMARLREALANPVEKTVENPDRVRLSEAVLLAGVSQDTLKKWCEKGVVTRTGVQNAFRYDRQEIMAQARRHWAATRLKRAVLPDWLLAEQSAP
jgi:transcriptional regulator with XRE-family HTH domain